MRRWASACGGPPRDARHHRSRRPGLRTELLPWVMTSVMGVQIRFYDVPEKTTAVSSVSGRWGQAACAQSSSERCCSHSIGKAVRSSDSPRRLRRSTTGSMTSGTSRVKATRAAFRCRADRPARNAAAVRGRLWLRLCKAAGYEADDFLAAAVADEEGHGGTVVVASGDRDAFQLASERTTILQPVRAGEMAHRTGGGARALRRRARAGARLSTLIICEPCTMSAPLTSS